MDKPKIKGTLQIGNKCFLEGTAFCTFAVAANEKLEYIQNALKEQKESDRQRISELVKEYKDNEESERESA